jgi:hypothetical protein
LQYKLEIGPFIILKLDKPQFSFDFRLNGGSFFVPVKNAAGGAGSEVSYSALRIISACFW